VIFLNFTEKIPMAELFLVPNILSEGEWQNVLPARIPDVLTHTNYFIVENLRTARRFLKQVNRDIDIDKLVFFELNKFTDANNLPEFLHPLSQGENVAVISEAGCPGIADPGAEIVKLAHQKGFRVVPLVGPSSVLLALMASGFNGQNFTFQGYLPVKPAERARAISSLEKKVINSNETQIFIETPYRNNQLVADILKTCSSSTLFCIAANITGDNEFIVTKAVGQWKSKVPDLHKQPAIFLLGK
jgi:16S rRNA (cytidine1402-2'-O)-methyltransferase